MTIDVNKIIMESIAADNKEPETKGDPIIENNTASNVNLENNSNTDENTEDNQDTYVYSPISAAIPAAISAGLGALTLRNRLRNIEK